MFLGIDLGTSSVKACVLRADGMVAVTSTAPLTTSHPFPSASEQDPAAWWQATCDAVAGLPPEIRAQIAAIGLSGQMHGAVLLDDQHKPIRPAILWNDGRASAECAAMIAADPTIGQITGAVPMPGFTAPKLLWLERHEPQAHARIAHVLLPKDYIGFRLHGSFITDPSDAAGTGWLNQTDRSWSMQACAVSATDLDWLPEIRDGAAAAGELGTAAADALGLPPGIPVAAGAGDAAAGAVGLGAVRDGDGFISLGTSGQLFVTTASYRPNPEARIHAYAHTVPGHWFQMAAMLNGARPMAWLADLVGQPIDRLLQEAAQAEPGPLFLPYLTGERTPHGDTSIRGAFVGLGETATPGRLMRAVIEAIAFTFADATQALSAAGTRPDRLLAIGGGTRSDLLMQMIADVIECDIGRSTGAEVGPALGAARLARACVSPDHAAPYAKAEPDRWFRPSQAQKGQHLERLEQYRALYRAVKGLGEI